MKIASFKGGIHPFSGKEASENKPIEVLKPSGKMVFPLRQHIGLPAKAVVEKDDRVLMGQMIGQAQDGISSNVISSVSGVVMGVENRLTASGNEEPVIVIENDQSYEPVKGFGQKHSLENLTEMEIRAIIKGAGIVGLGGAGFPTHIKLSPENAHEIEFVIVNGAECEPCLTSDYRLMIEQPEKLIGGLKVILRLFPNAKGVIAVEDNKPEAIKILTRLTENETAISVQVLKTKYPQGGERTLIYAVTGRKISASFLPAQKGCIVDNVDTVISIYQAVCEGIPLIRRILTVTGNGVGNSGNFHVPLGMSYEQVLSAAGGYSGEVHKMISGGPMMGQELVDLQVPVTKISSALIFLEEEEECCDTTACIRCGRCVKVCPSQIVPQMMIRAVQQENRNWFEALDGMECCECGCCSYACPARIPLTQSFRFMRQEIRKKSQVKKEDRHE